MDAKGVFFSDCCLLPWIGSIIAVRCYSNTTQIKKSSIRSIYHDNELVLEATCKEYLQVRTEGKRKIERQLKHYN